MVFYFYGRFYNEEVESLLGKNNSDIVIYKYLKQIQRIAKVERKTSETNILIELNLDGSGNSLIDTGIGFFNHMLEQLARHSNIDLTIEVKGDLHIDEHHTIEDTGITLGMAIAKALGNKSGIKRYGFPHLI